jgi:glycosyltransferase involved in cell wall biosynthesis
VDRFLRVANILSERTDVHFLVVGDGELRTTLQPSHDSARLGDRLTWTGFRRDIADIYFASDVVALTSDNEGTPLSLIESLAAGTPVVSTEVGGVASVAVNGETALTVPPDQEGGLADAAARLLDDADLAEHLAQQGRQHVLKSFGLERLSDDLDSLYRRLLSERAGHSCG